VSNKTKLQELGREMANICLGGQPGEKVVETISGISAELTRVAMVESGVRMEELTDENMEDSPIVRLYYAHLAIAWSKVLTEAADLQTYFKSLEA